MKIELLLAHPKQGREGRLGGGGGGGPCSEYLHTFQVEKHPPPVLARYGSGKFPGLDLIVDAAIDLIPLNPPSSSTDTTETFSMSSGQSHATGDESGPEETGNAPIKPKRKRANAVQLESLKKTFQQSPFPSSEIRKRLAKELGMTPRSVQIWFQNQRQLARNLIDKNLSEPFDK